MPENDGVLIEDMLVALVALMEEITTPLPGIQNVLTERPPIENTDEFRRRFAVVAPGGGKMLNAWFIEPPLDVTDPTIQAGRMVTNWTLPVVAYFSTSDKVNSAFNPERILRQLLQAVKNKLLRTEEGYTLSGTAVNVRQVRTGQPAPVFFGKYLTNMGTVEVDVLTRTQFVD